MTLNIGDRIPLWKTGGSGLDRDSVIALEATGIPSFDAWARVIYAGGDRGTDFISFCQYYDDGLEQTNNDEVFGLVMANAGGAFDSYKALEPPSFSYPLMILGADSPVSRMKAWVELMCADREKGLDFLQLFEDWDLLGNQAFNDEYFMRVILNTEIDYPNLIDYKVNAIDMPYSSIQSPVVNALSWMELFLADHTAGLSLLDYYLTIPSIANDVANSTTAMTVIMALEDTSWRDYRQV